MVYDKICLMLPTYKRSKTYLPAFIYSAITTSSPERVSFLFCVNKNDTETFEFLRNYDFRGFDFETIVEELPSPNLARYFNMLYDHVRSDQQTYGREVVVTMVGDDMVFETLQWDRRMLDLINAYGGVGVFWANDAYIAHERCAVNLFVSQDMVEATGRPFMCEEFEADQIDVVWTEVGRLTRTSHYDPDIVIRHNHSSRGPEAGWDPTFKRLNAIQQTVYARGGKSRAKQVAREIADVLLAKGFKGTSIC